MKRVLVTGGNRGIGLEITKRFVKTGLYEVIVLGRDFTEFPESLKASTKQVVFDLEQTEKIAQLALEIGEIDILINNAGILNSVLYNEYDSRKKQSIIKVNLEAPVELITEFSKGMIKKGAGRVVNISSIAGQIGQTDVWYAITKAGVINLTKSFAKILGPDGVVINCVAPGPVDTEMFKLIPDDRRKRVLDRTVTGRPAHTHELAEAVYWFAAECPDYINGTCLDVNNGATLR